MQQEHFVCSEDLFIRPFSVWIFVHEWTKEAGERLPDWNLETGSNKLISESMLFLILSFWERLHWCAARAVAVGNNEEDVAFVVGLSSSDPAVLHLSECLLLAAEEGEAPWLHGATSYACRREAAVTPTPIHPTLILPLFGLCCDSVTILRVNLGHRCLCLVQSNSANSFLFFIYFRWKLQKCLRWCVGSSCSLKLFDLSGEFPGILETVLVILERFFKESKAIYGLWEGCEIFYGVISKFVWKDWREHRKFNWSMLQGPWQSFGKVSREVDVVVIKVTEELPKSMIASHWPHSILFVIMFILSLLKLLSRELWLGWIQSESSLVSMETVSSLTENPGWAC